MKIRPEVLVLLHADGQLGTPKLVSHFCLFVANAPINQLFRILEQAKASELYGRNEIFAGWKGFEIARHCYRQTFALVWDQCRYLQ
jgi:hypothetical protein